MNTAPQPSRIRSLAAFIAIAIAPLVGTFSVLLVAPNYQWTTELRDAPFGSDFLQEWIGGHILISGDSDRLYDAEYSKSLQHDRSLLGFAWDANAYYPMVYPPFYYAAVSPWSTLDYSLAARLWCVFNGLAMSAALLLLALMVWRRQRTPWILIATAFFSPFLLSLGMGQKSGFILMILTASLALADGRRFFLAGICLGLLAFKPHLLLVFLFGLAWLRHYRMLVGALLVVGVSVTWSMAMGASSIVGFWNVVSGTTHYIDHLGYQLENAHNLWGFARGALGSTVAASMTALIGSVATCYWLSKILSTSSQKQRWTDDRFATQFSALSIATVLLSPHFYTYDLTLLILPMAVVAWQFRGFLPIAAVDRAAIANQKNRRVGENRQSNAVHWIPLLAVAVYLCVGLSVDVAEFSGVQLTTPMLLAWLYGWSREHDFYRAAVARRAAHPASSGGNCISWRSAVNYGSPINYFPSRGK